MEPRTCTQEARTAWVELVVSLRHVSWHTQAGPDPVRGLGSVAMAFG